MTQLLMKLFVRTTLNPEDPDCRSACGRLAGWVGIACNVLLFLCKLLAGLLAGSVSILADAVNNLTDASGSLVTLLGFRLASLPADPKHPYGHGRMEYIAGLAVAAMIFVLGAQMVKSSVTAIFHPAPVAFTWITALVLVLSIGVKLWLSRFSSHLGNLIHSPTLMAAAADSKNDVRSTLAVLASGLLSCLGWQLDGYIGLVVAAMILWTGVQVTRDTINPLLGTPPDGDYVRRLQKKLLSYEKVLGVHDLMLHDYGPGRRFATVHVEMDCREDPLVCHDIIDRMERDFADQEHLMLTIHYDPVVTDDRELLHLRTIVRQELRFLDERLSIHDFRMVRGPERTNLIFDLVVPYDLLDQKEALQQRLLERVRCGHPEYNLVITFDEKYLD